MVRLVRDVTVNREMHTIRAGRAVALPYTCRPDPCKRAEDCEPRSEHESAIGLAPRGRGMAFRVDPLFLLRLETGHSSTSSVERFVAAWRTSGK